LNNIYVTVLALAFSAAALGQSTSVDPSARARPAAPMTTGEDKGKAAAPSENPAGGTQPDMKRADPASRQEASGKAEIKHRKKLHRKAANPAKLNADKGNQKPEEGK